MNFFIGTYMKKTKQSKESTETPNQTNGRSRPNLIDGMELEEFLSEGSKYKLSIEKIVGELGNSFSLLLAVSPREFAKAKLAVLKRFEKENGIILYITFNQPATKIIAELPEKGIDKKKIFFIDMVSKGKGDDVSSLENISGFESPTLLTDLLLLIDEKTSSKEKPSVLLIDSISTMLVYNEKEMVHKFLHSLATKIHNANSRVVLLASKDSDSIET